MTAEEMRDRALHAELSVRCLRRRRTPPQPAAAASRLPVSAEAAAFVDERDRRSRAAGDDVRARVVRVLLVRAAHVREARHSVSLGRPRLGRVPAGRPGRRRSARRSLRARRSARFRRSSSAENFSAAVRTCSTPTSRGASRSCSTRATCTTTAPEGGPVHVPADLVASAIAVRSASSVNSPRARARVEERLLARLRQPGARCPHRPRFHLVRRHQ